jgi:hypothetical protein
VVGIFGIGEVIMKRAAYALVLGCLGWLNPSEAFAQQFDFAKFRDKISDKYKNVLLIGISKADERGSVTVYFSADTVAQVSMGQIQKQGNWFIGTCTPVNNDARWVCSIVELSAKGYWFE